MQKPKACIFDNDDVLQNFGHVLMQLRRTMYGVNDSVYNMRKWELTREQYDTFRAYEPWIYARMQPKRGVKKTLKQIRKKGYAIIVMTARNKKFKTETIASLRYHGLPSDEILFNKNKVLKINKLQEHYDIIGFVDDKPSTIESVAKKTNIPHIFLMDMPCNRGIKIKNSKRIKSLKEILEFL